MASSDYNYTFTVVVS